MKHDHQVLLLLCAALLSGRASAQQVRHALDPKVSATNETVSLGSYAPAFKSEADKLSYALGVNAATQLRKYSLEVNPDVYSQGLRGALSGSNLLLTAEEAAAIVAAKQKDLAGGQQGRNSPASQRLADKNKTDGEAFLTENRTREGVVSLPSGLQYRVLRAGTGKRPSLEDTVVCNYRGTLIDGTEFDSTARRGRPGTFPLGKVVKGWREALQLMPVGSKWQIVLPPHLAYGIRRAGRTIGPNSTLVFDLELLAIKETPASPVQATAQDDEDEAAQDPEELPRAQAPGL